MFMRMVQTQTLMLDRSYCVFRKCMSLIESGHYDDGIRVTMGRLKMEKYNHNKVEALFVGCFPEWKGEYFRYYQDRAVSLKEHPDVNPQMLNTFDEFLCKCVVLAQRLYDENFGGLNLTWLRKIARAAYEEGVSLTRDKVECTSKKS